MGLLLPAAAKAPRPVCRRRYSRVQPLRAQSRELQEPPSRCSWPSPGGCDSPGQQETFAIGLVVWGKHVTIDGCVQWCDGPALRAASSSPARCRHQRSRRANAIRGWAPAARALASCPRAEAGVSIAQRLRGRPAAECSVQPSRQFYNFGGERLPAAIDSERGRDGMRDGQHGAEGVSIFEPRVVHPGAVV